MPVDEAHAGEIVAIAGMSEATVADTLCDLSVTEPIVAQPVDPPTLSMTFRINDGPFAGQEGDKVQSRVIRDRLLREGERNIAIKVVENDDKDSFIVSGRGELQLKARVNGSVSPGVVAAKLDWAKLTPGGKNINVLTSEKLTDMGNSATFYSVLVEVELFQAV